jgi:hypothetical protein
VIWRDKEPLAVTTLRKDLTLYVDEADGWADEKCDVPSLIQEVAAQPSVFYKFL